MLRYGGGEYMLVNQTSIVLLIKYVSYMSLIL